MMLKFVCKFHFMRDFGHLKQSKEIYIFKLNLKVFREAYIT